VVSVVQEKFQVNYPGVDDDNGNTWKSDRSARTKKGTPGREGLPGGDWASKKMDNAVFYPSLPPGTDIPDQEMADIRKMRAVTAGTDDVTDNPSGSDFVKGHVSLGMKPTDDMYTREHNDAFYDDLGGFVERNNYLDRM
jgi:hypothetical protein